jgi:hypothetical protein
VLAPITKKGLSEATLTIRLITGLGPRWTLAMNDRAATQIDNRSSAGGRSPFFHSPVLRSNEKGRQTLGFPSLQANKRKTVWFDPPRCAVYTFDGGAAYTDCLVLGIWDGGAKLRVRNGDIPVEFDLLFALGPRPVWRRCKRSSTCDNVMDVEFKKATPRFVMEP